jgi:hypothetical protein
MRHGRLFDLQQVLRLTGQVDSAIMPAILKQLAISRNRPLADPLFLKPKVKPIHQTIIRGEIP